MNRIAHTLATREQRMAQGKIDRRINGVRHRLFEASLRKTGRRLTEFELAYLRYLCGQGPDFGSLKPEEKAPIANMFERAHKGSSKADRNLSAEAMPGLAAVYDNRKVVRDTHKANGKRKQAASG